MKTDQDLIFEAYAKTLNEGSHLYGDTELGLGKYKASDVTITDYDIDGLTPVGVGGGYENVPVEFEDDNGTTMTGIVDSLYIDDTGAVDTDGMIHDAEVGTLTDEDNEDFGNTDYDVEEGNVFERLEELLRNKPELENDLKPILNDFQDIIEDINSLDVDDYKIDVTDLGLHINRLFPDV